MPGFTWPPRDTDRNRILCRAQVVLYALVTLYFGVFALASGALVPWTITALALAATIVAVVALLLMRAQRQAADAADPAPADGRHQDQDQDRRDPAAPGR